MHITKDWTCLDATQIFPACQLTCQLCRACVHVELCPQLLASPVFILQQVCKHILQAWLVCNLTGSSHTRSTLAQQRVPFAQQVCEVVALSNCQATGYAHCSEIDLSGSSGGLLLHSFALWPDAAGCQAAELQLKPLVCTPYTCSACTHMAVAAAAAAATAADSVQCTCSSSTAAHLRHDLVHALPAGRGQ